MNLIRHKKIGFIGTGSMGQALIKGLIKSSQVMPKNIYVFNRSEKKQEKVVQTFEVNGVKSNEEIVELCDYVFLCVKPQDFQEALLPIAPHFQESQVVISLAAGISIRSIKKILPTVQQIVRVMPNTAVKVDKGVIGYCVSSAAEPMKQTIEEMLSGMGVVVEAEEGDQFEALTVSCSSGTGFVFELMMYWQDWLEERGFDAQTARQMTVQTFIGAATLAESQPNIPLVSLQDEVTSKKGVTYAGLESMRSLDVEQLLRNSFDRASLRDRELGQNLY